MPVYVKGKGCRSVTQIPLNGLHVVPILERKYRVSMAQIMDFGIRCTDLDSKLLEMVIDRLRLKRRSEERREGQGGPMLRLRLPTLPGNGGVFLLSDLTGLIVYYAKRTYALESSRNYDLLCDLVIHDSTSGGHVIGYALEIYNAGNKVARNVKLTIEGQEITTINFIKPNSSYVFPVGKLLQMLGENIAVGDNKVPIKQGCPISVALSVDGVTKNYSVNTDLLFATRNTDTGSMKGIEDHLEKLEKAIKGLTKR